MNRLTYKWTHNLDEPLERSLCWSESLEVSLKVIVFLISSWFLCFVSWLHDLAEIVCSTLSIRDDLSPQQQSQAAMGWNHEWRQAFLLLVWCFLSYWPRQWKPDIQSPTWILNYTWMWISNYKRTGNLSVRFLINKMLMLWYKWKTSLEGHNSSTQRSWEQLTKSQIM